VPKPRVNLTRFHGRVFNIAIETCSQWGGVVQVIACIEDPAVIEKILSHLNKKTASAKPPRCTRAGHPHKQSCLTHPKEKINSHF
jgi:hypothetical protein